MQIDEDKKTERVAGIEAVEEARRRAEVLGVYPGDDDAEAFSLGTVHGGAAVQLLDEEMARVAANILDVETKAEAPRKITLVVTVVPDASRQSARLIFESSVKLAPKNPKVATIGIGEDINGDIVVASHDVRQGMLRLR